MIISHKYKFIFVRTRKTASTSIEIAFSQMLCDKDIITPFCPRDERLRAELCARGPQNYLESWKNYSFKDVYGLLFRSETKKRFYNHMPAAEIKALIGEEIWHAYFKFCFERNPWDKVISLYYHRYKNEPRPPLSEFIHSRQCAAAFNYNLYTIGEEVALDFLGRYERLEEDLAKITTRLNMPSILPLPKAKSQFRQDVRYYGEVLSPEERDIISEVFSKEITLFGYKF